MEYSPDCAIPYLSRVDAGTAETVRRRGVEIVSSGDLVQQFEAVVGSTPSWRRTAPPRRRCTASRIARSPPVPPRA